MRKKTSPTPGSEVTRYATAANGSLNGEPSCFMSSALRAELWHSATLSALRAENVAARPHADFAAWDPTVFRLLLIIDGLGVGGEGDEGADVGFYFYGDERFLGLREVEAVC